MGVEVDCLLVLQVDEHLAPQVRLGVNGAPGGVGAAGCGDEGPKSPNPPG